MFKKIIALFFFSWSLLLFISSGIVESQDGLQYLTIARQMYYHHTFAMPAADYPLDNIHMNVTPGKNGVKYSPTGLGFSVAYLPAVALEDAFNKVAGLQPTEKFPLDNDWPIMLFASMTNATFGALIIVTFYAFLKSFSFEDKRALLLAFALFLSSNLLVYSKHAFAHEMFISCMFLSFYFIRRYHLTHKKFEIVWASVSYGIVLLSYNPTFLLPVPALIIYYLLGFNWYTKKSIKDSLLIVLTDCLIATISIAPFFALYGWFNWVRFGGGTSTGYGEGGIEAPPIPSGFVLYEGLWGLLFSPGKTIFLFTPALLILVLFWFKLQKRYIPEMAAAGAVFFVYLFFIASLVGGPDFYPWHGEASFGPRYLLPILPLLLLLVAFIYRQLSTRQKGWIFWPIICIGIIVQSVGVLIPYQVRFSGFEYQIYLNGHRITYDLYANFIPRFSPFYTMSKWLVRTALQIPNNYIEKPAIEGWDGMHGVLPTSQGDWRQIEPLSALEVSKKAASMPIELTFLNNVATESATPSAKAVTISAEQNGAVLTKIAVAPQQQTTMVLSPSSLSADQPLLLMHEYQATDSASLPNQATYITSIKSGQTPVELENYNYPYVSRVSQKLFNQKYYYWGGEDTKLWDLWNMRSINYVHTLDLWWLRPFHYWDLPKDFFAVLFFGNVAICSVSGYYVVTLHESTPGRKKK